MTDNTEKPLVYSCSGCSNIAQLANDIAITMDREDHAEMSCIAGVGGNVKPIVKKAISGRDIIAIDGCPLNCVKSCLEKHQITPTFHFNLTNLGIKKKYKEECSMSDGYRAMQTIYGELGFSNKE
ncbi:MAG: putative zinc-binding protein [Cellvibrionaceae bacterium]